VRDGVRIAALPDYGWARGIVDVAVSVGVSTGFSAASRRKTTASRNPRAAAITGDGGGLFFPTTHHYEFVEDVEDSVLFDAVRDSSVVTCAVRQERV
jgi:hypothetical protein